MARDPKTLPYDRDAERAVLGAILLDNKSISQVIPILTAHDFFDAGGQLTENGLIYAEIRAMHEAGMDIDLITLSNSLEKHGKLAMAGGIAYISKLIDGVPRVSNVTHYAEIVREKSRLRLILRTTDKWRTRALDPSTNAADLFSDLEMFTKQQVATPTSHEPSNGHRKTYYPLIDFLKAQFPVPEHLVEGLIPRGGHVMIVALPHRLKSWLTTGLALGCTVAGKALGALEVPKPVRTMLVQVEDPPGDLQWRITQLMSTGQFNDCDPAGVAIIERNQFTAFTKEWCKWLTQQILDHKSDLVVLDVMRRLFVGRGDVNSPQDSADFLEEIDEIGDITGAAIVLVHHENKKDAELMLAAAGSYNFGGWAQVMVQIKHKKMDGSIAKVEIEVDNKLGQALEPMRMILDLSSPVNPLRMELLEDGEGFEEAMKELASEWTVKDLMEVLEVHRSNAQRRLKKWELAHKIQKVEGGKRGRHGGLARYTACDNGEDCIVPSAPPPKRVQ